MKLGFLFDVRFTEYNGDYYSTNLTQDFWNKRYLKFFDEIIVVGRYISVETDPSKKLVKSSSDKVHFYCIEETSSINRMLTQKQQNEFIKKQIAECDRVICRSWWGTAACEELGIPYMIEVVNCIRDSYWNHSLLGKIVALPNYYLQKKAIRKAPYVLYVTQSFLQKRYPSPHNCIGVSDVELNEESAFQKEQLLKKRLERIDDEKDLLKIGTAGAVSVRYKGQQYVIKALAELKNRGIENIEYQLVGSGDASYLEATARKYGVENQIKILGPIPHDRIFAWYDSLDLYIQPSLTEGLPRALIEAMSRGLPCIGSNAGGIPELLESKYIFDKQKPIDKQIADIYCLISKKEMKEMANNNMEKAENFNAEVLNRRRDAFLSQFCGLSVGIE